MMWKTKEVYNDLLYERGSVEPRFAKNIPYWKVIEDMGDAWFSRLAWAVLYTLVYIEFADYWFLYLLLPFHYLMGPVHGAIVNWCGHMYGYQNFDNKDQSRNSLVWDFLMMGELFQNNHHKYGARPNFAMKGWEIDPTYPVMKFLQAVGIIKLNKVAAAGFGDDGVPKAA